MARPSRQEIISYATEVARKYGLDPEVFLAVINGESGFNPAAVGDQGQSFGLAQLYMGGGLGNVYEQKYGKRPDNPDDWMSQLDFMGQEVAQGGKGYEPWHAAKRAGIGDFQGVPGHDQPHTAGSPGRRDRGVTGGGVAPDYANNLSGMTGADDMNIFGIPNSELAEIFKERNSTDTQTLGGKLWEQIDPSVKGMAKKDRPQGLLGGIMNYGKGTGGQAQLETPPVGPDAERKLANDPHYNPFSPTATPKKKKGATVGSTIAGMFAPPKPPAQPAVQQSPMSDPKTLLGFLVGKKLFEQA